VLKNINNNKKTTITTFYSHGEVLNKKQRKKMMKKRRRFKGKLKNHLTVITLHFHLITPTTTDKKCAKLHMYVITKKTFALGADVFCCCVSHSAQLLISIIKYR